MNKPYYQRVSFRLLKRLRRSVDVRVGASTFAVPLDGAGALACLHWQPTWMTALIGAALRFRDGAVIDGGANVGQTLFDVCAAEPGRPYYGFEPNPACVHFLECLIAANGLTDCTIVPTGLSDRAALVPLYLTTGHAADSAATILPEFRPGRATKARYVPCFRFDDVWEQVGRPEVSLVKIDVEGAELHVLRGMTGFLASRRPLVVCEILFADANANFDDYRSRVNALTALLVERRYSIFRIDHHVEDGVRLRPLPELPLAVWTHENAEDCDYAFVPEEDVQRLREFGVANGLRLE